VSFFSIIPNLNVAQDITADIPQSLYEAIRNWESAGNVPAGPECIFFHYDLKHCTQ
jgi:hypothetical protein